MVAVGEFDTAGIEFKPLGNVVSMFVDDYLGERGLAGGVVVDEDEARW